MELKPFSIHISQADLDDLHARLAQTRWPSERPNVGWSRGVPLAYLQKLAAYWRDNFDWRKQEAALNQFPQFTTEVDGQTIHFLHVRSPEPNALPLIITHGYPGSIAEFMKITGPLTDPRAYGGDPADAFDVVAASLPGFGFSVPVSESGWAVAQTAKAFAQIMQALGYEHYGAHGGDIGAGVAGSLGTYAPDHVVAVHINTDPTALALFGAMLPAPDSPVIATLSESEQALANQLRQYGAEGKGYLEIQSTRPQTLAYGLNDSPVEQLAWIVEKFKEWINPTNALPEDGVDLDQLLTNISLYWFTGTGATAANFIYDAFHTPQDWGAPRFEPTGTAVFAANSLMRKLLDPQQQASYWSEYAEGGHFPAMEVPDLLVGDLRTYFRQYRSK